MAESDVVGRAVVPLTATGEAAPPASAVSIAPSHRSRLGRAVWWQMLDRHPILGLAVVLFVLPLAVPEKTLVIDILVLGLFAMSFNLLLGYTGLLSFGHSTYMGLGAYAAGIMLIRYTRDFWSAVAVALVVSTSAAAVIGWFCLRRRQVYFSMLTLAFNQLVFFLAFHARTLTGGDDGLRNMPLARFGAPGIWGFTVDKLNDPYRFYYLTYALVLLSLLAIRRIIESPLGRGLQAIRESEERAQACGFDTNRLQWLSFIFAGFFAGLAGALNAMSLHFVHTDDLNWFLAGTVVIMTILGGRGTFVGPFVGAAVFLVLREYLSRITTSWLLITGAVFVLFVILFPQGIWGTLKALLEGETRLVRWPWRQREEPWQANIQEALVDDGSIA